VPADVAKDGTKVEVDGKVDGGVMGIAMTGPTLVVKSAKRV
jgi:hypothetical protein